MAARLGTKRALTLGKGGGLQETFAEFVAYAFAGAPAGLAVNVAAAATRWRDSTGTVPATVAGTDTIGRLSDISGNNNHLLQVGSSAKPLYGSDGTLHWIAGDGIDDHLRAAFGISQPWERISAIRQISWTSLKNVYNGVTAGAGQLYQSGASPNLLMGSGAGINTDPDPAVGADCIIVERHNGASSRVGVDKSAYVTGDAGTTLPGGVTVFANTVNGNAGNIRLYASIMRAGTFTDAEIARAVAIMARLQGRNL